jgi:cyclopropane fatty-acyl-phospholipid synthase-like methyltransferase
MFSFSTEITSSNIQSDNPLFQRTLKAYHLISEKVYGGLLEIGCGEGYGLDLIVKKANTLTVIDKSKYVLDKIKNRYPKNHNTTPKHSTVNQY